MNLPTLVGVQQADFDEMAAIRIEVLRDSLKRLGRFDAARARERLIANFAPEDMRHVLLGGERVGYVTLRPKSIGQPQSRLLEHLYIRNEFQNRGLGLWVLKWAKAQATFDSCDIRLSALKQSDANRFYLRNGFVQVSEDEFDLNYYWKHDAKEMA